LILSLVGILYRIIESNGFLKKIIESNSKDHYILHSTISHSFVAALWWFNYPSSDSTTPMYHDLKHVKTNKKKLKLTTTKEEKLQIKIVEKIVSWWALRNKNERRLTEKEAKSTRHPFIWSLFNLHYINMHPTITTNLLALKL